MRRLAVLLVALSAAMLATPAWAHQTAASRLEVNVRTKAHAVDLLFMLPVRDLGDHLELDQNGDGVTSTAEVRTAEPRITAYLDRTVAVIADHARCPAKGAAVMRLSKDATHVLWFRTYLCPHPILLLRLEVRSMFEVGGYRHFARIQVGSHIYATVFSPRVPWWEMRIGRPPRVGQVMLRFGWQGILHILSGPDHVLFVISLLLVARSLEQLLGVVTAFTVAHTTTLLLSALNVVTLSPRIAEPAIALTIAWVAAENLRFGLSGTHPPRHRYIVTFAFGLVHGFAFSYVLRSELSLPTHTLLPALFSFNGGVEIGQAIVVVGAWPLVRLAMRLRAWPRILVVVSSAILAIATWWFVVRAIGH